MRYLKILKLSKSKILRILTTRDSYLILEDPNIRIKLSEHSNWPTIPQLFVNGELIGGADITTELHNNGQLLDILDKANK